MRYRPLIIPRYGPLIQQSPCLPASRILKPGHLCKVRATDAGRSAGLGTGDDVGRGDEGRRRGWHPTWRGKGLRWCKTDFCLERLRMQSTQSGECMGYDHEKRRISATEAWGDLVILGMSPTESGHHCGFHQQALGICRCDVWPHHYLDRQACSEFELLEDVATWVGSVSKLVTWHGNFKAQQSYRNLRFGAEKNRNLMIYSISIWFERFATLKTHGETPEIHGFSSVLVALNSLRAVRNCTGKSTSASWAGDWAIIQEIWTTFGRESHNPSI